ncbi:Flagellar motility protein MotE, a chaperone for MotC folding [Cohaesibacter marisflavi]|uniref:Flagellar motility protein MotE, a chaperone for MotC folding n=1 Tax=Cohaesibacter marisflavi TaxID=655353 RepID=A0A1I5J131_9HYPH|nr:hypothetical protein [Cohaesibacter marisflavi]SFO66498.1 Flagellar motility protein MotE, a chaperone for MotC folding [Cohaesibacter marisflavi]
MTQVRLLPTVLIAVVGLLFIKVAHLVVYSDMSAVSTTPALAQEAPAPAADGGAAAGDTGNAPAPADMPAPNMDEEPPSLVDGMRIDPTQSSRSELAILERLANRRKELDERARSIEMREALLKAAEKRLQQRVDELKSLEQTIALATKKRDEEQQADINRLVAMYSSMKSKQAAQIFEVMDQDILLDIVKSMKSRKLAAIMGQMKAESASSLSAAIANSNSLEQNVQSLAADELPQIGN